MSPHLEAQHRAREAAAKLRDLETESDRAKSALATALGQLADGDAAASTEKVNAARAVVESMSARLAAAREAVTLAEATAAEAVAKIEADKAAADAGFGSTTVGAPNVTKDPRYGFASHREFLMSAIRNSGLKSRDQVGDDRLKALAVQDSTDRHAAGELAFMLPAAFTPSALRGAPLAAAGSDEQGVYDDRYGGFAVGKTMLPGILSIGFEGDPTAGRTQPIPMATPSVDMLARTDKDHSTSVSGGFTVTRRPEAAAATASRGAVELVSLKAQGLFGLAYATEELLSDSPISFVSILEAGFRDQFGAHLLNEKLRGGGGNEYLGVLTALSSSSLGPTVSVAKESGQANDTIVSNNVIKMAARCWGLDSAIWLANHDTRPHLFTLSVTVGTGGVLLYQPSRGEGFPDMLLGRPVFYTEYASKLGDQGDLILGNWSQYLEGLYQPLQSAESIHVRFSNHERTFKFWLRNAGAPWWRTALTPAKSTATLSPFVVMDAR